MRSLARALLRLAALLALCFLGLPRSLEGRERIDVVRLVEGDRVTGEIVSLVDGLLTVRTLAFGTVEIEWTDVVALISVQRFDLERSDGVRLSGHFDEGESPGTLRVRAGDEELVEIPLAEVFSIRQLGATIRQSRRGRLNFGLDYTHANEDTRISLDAELSFQGERFAWKNKVSSSIKDDAGSDRRERDHAESQLEIPAGTRFVWVGRASLERNDELSLDSRITAAAGLLWLPWRSTSGRFGFGAGLSQSEEKYVGDASSSTVSGVLMLLGGEYHRFGAFGTVASMELLYVSMTSGPTRHRIEVRSSLSQKIARNFNIAVSPYYSFDSRPPSANPADEDWGWISSVGWTF